MQREEVLAIIAARGGSKGVPRKNIRLLCGKPLIAWTIEEAKKSKLLTRCIVSTDDAEIAETATQYGAEVPFWRPKEIADDLAHSVDVVIHALDILKNDEGYVPEAIVLLPPTAPLRDAEDIDVGIELLLKSPEADSVRPITESSKHPYKALALDGAYLKPFFSKKITGFDEPYDMPRQILPKAYIYSGAMQAAWTRTIIDQRSLSGRKSKYFFIRAEKAINIDTVIDFQLAEMLMAERFKK